MFEALQRAVQEFLAALSPEESKAFGFGLQYCPQCKEPLIQGWVKSGEPIYFHAGKWDAPPSALKTLASAAPPVFKLRTHFRLPHLLSYLSTGAFLAAARCPDCQLIVMKYED